MSKPYAFLQTMNKNQWSFEKIGKQTVGWDAPTRYPLSIHFVIENVMKNAGKMAKFNLWKSNKK